MRKKLLKIY